ncbi:MAG: L,D-transpeptidase [Paracoccus sp. (in: a-proteobacteria)]|nr:L,D-transpeptidase [Paracoccus sp. (in: a-proteobacteria)]
MTQNHLRTLLPRRAFLGGVVALGAGVTAASAQDAQRNISSFRARHWSEFFPDLGPGVILADVTSRAVHYWSGDQQTYRVYPSSIPMTDQLTRRGLTEVVRKAEKPSWTPTADMRSRDPSLPARVEGGAPDNPLGPFALYLSWPAYLIHGTHDTRKIGRRSSSGCYGLYNEHITELYGMAQVGTRVAVF